MESKSYGVGCDIEDFKLHAISNRIDFNISRMGPNYNYFYGVDRVVGDTLVIPEGITHISSVALNDGNDLENLVRVVVPSTAINLYMELRRVNLPNFRKIEYNWDESSSREITMTMTQSLTIQINKYCLSVEDIIDTRIKSLTVGDHHTSSVRLDQGRFDSFLDLSQYTELESLSGYGNNLLSLSYIQNGSLNISRSIPLSSQIRTISAISSKVSSIRATLPILGSAFVKS